MTGTCGERLDVLDAAGALVGEASRREVHERGLWHRTFHCWVRGAGSPSALLLQKRHMNKQANPGKWDVSSAGHLLAGETPADGLRELEEELGIRASFEDLVAVGLFHEESVFGGMADREFTHVYLLADAWDMSRVRPAPAEISALCEIDADALLWLLAEGDSLPVPGAEVLPGGDVRTGRTIVRREEIVDRPAGYYRRVAETLKRLGT
jgi:isopentenyldiphosphate isomerase